MSFYQEIRDIANKTYKSVPDDVYRSNTLKHAKSMIREAAKDGRFSIKIPIVDHQSSLELAKDLQEECFQTQVTLKESSKQAVLVSWERDLPTSE